MNRKTKPLQMNSIGVRKIDTNKENEQIRANRLSNREVVLSSVARGLINSPSTTYVNECKNTNMPPTASCSTNYQMANIEVATGDQNMHAIDKISANVVDADADDEQILSQYEIDIVNKYLNELCDGDDSDGDVVGVALTADGRVNDSSDDESEQRSVIEVLDANASDTWQASDKAMTVHAYDVDADESTADTDDSRSTARTTSRRSHLRCVQTNQANANNADVNNNNMSLISIASNPSVGHAVAADTTAGQRANRFSEPNRRTNTNAANMNLPMIVGITSCVWGLCLFAMKSLYSDVT